MFRISCAFAIGCALVASSVDAAQRTFVSTSGSDAAPCSAVIPCRSFGKAITVTDPNGEIIVLDSGGYGAVAIDRSVSIIAPPGIYAGISVFTGNGIDINTAGVKVALRGLFINGQGGDRGIHFVNGAELRVDGCSISGLATGGIETATGRVFVHDTIIRNNDGAGMYVVNTEATLDRVRVEANGDDGVQVTGASTVVLRDSVIVDNGNVGLFPATSSLTRLDVEATTISGNANGGLITFDAGVNTKAEVTVARSDISRNGHVGVQVGTNAHVSVSDSTITGNFGHGVSVGNGGTAVATRNVVTKNAFFGFSNSGGTFETRSDNSVVDNFGGVTAGAMTPVGGV